MTTENKTEKKSKMPEWLKTFLSYFVFVLLGIGIIVVLKVSGINMVNISGESMSPTFHNRTMLVVKAHKHQHEDIILFNPSKSWDENTKKTYIKRIKALPGDEVSISDKEVKVNGKVIKKIDPEFSGKYDVKNGKFLVPDGKIFVMGDNTGYSNDSLFQYYLGNNDFLVDEKQVDFSGDKVFSFQYWFN